jgi:fucose permease
MIALLSIISLAFILICSVKDYWESQPETESEGLGVRQTISGKLTKKADQCLSILIFFMHTGILTIISSLMSSYLVTVYDAPIGISGLTVTIFLASLTVARMISGVIVSRLGNLVIIRIGLIIAIAGCTIGFLSKDLILFEITVVIIGIGAGPVFPCLIHETPKRFSSEIAKHLVGYQIAAAQLGGSLISSVAAILLSRVNMLLLFPIVIALFGLIIICNETVVRHINRVKHNGAKMN